MPRSIRTTTAGSGTVPPTASVSYSYDAGRRVTRIEHRNPVGLAMLQMNYTYTPNDLPDTIVEKDNLGWYWLTRATTTWYYYTAAGNVRWIVSDPPAGGGMQPQYMMAGPGDTESGTAVSAVDEFAVDGVTTESPVDGDGLDGGGGMMAMMSGGGTCPTGSNKYTATRFEYAKNGETVTYVLGEQWCWDGNPENCPTYYTVTYAREFRYDGARARYMNAPLDPATLAPYP